MSILKKTGRRISCRVKALYFNLFGKNNYKYIICKNCSSCIRLPKNKGTLIITCPDCGSISQIDT